MTTPQPTGYWLNIFTPETWQEFQGIGANVARFNCEQADRAKVQVDDVLLCYLKGKGLSKFVGALRVTSPRFKGDKRYPAHFRVEAITRLLDPDSGVRIHDLLNQLTIRKPKPRTWNGHVLSTLTKWKREDAEVVIDACR